MRFKLKPGQKFTTDHSEHLALAPQPVLPERIHIFSRTGPEIRHIKNTFSGNIHDRFVLWVCVSGTGRLLVDNISYTLKENDIFLTFPGQPHMRLYLEGHRVQWLLVRFSARPPEWFHIFRSKLMHLSPLSTQRLQQLAEAYFDASEKQTLNAANECSYSLGLLLSALYETAVAENPESRLQAAPGSDLVNQVCQLLLDPAYAGKPFGIIAAKLNFSAGHLREIFKARTGYTPKHLMDSNRIYRIKQLLQHSNLNITQVAEKCGFDSVYSFSRFFRKNGGISPREYRKQYKP